MVDHVCIVLLIIKFPNDLKVMVVRVSLIDNSHVRKLGLVTWVKETCFIL